MFGVTAHSFAKKAYIEELIDTMFFEVVIGCGNVIVVVLTDANVVQLLLDFVPSVFLLDSSAHTLLFIYFTSLNVFVSLNKFNLITI